MKILFIGGTGRLSSDVAKLALHKKNKVYLLTRGSDKRKRYINPEYTMIYADIRNKVDCKEKIEGLKFDVIIDFLTYNVEELKSTLEIINGHYKQYVFISTATVYDKIKKGEKITEKNTPKGNSKWSYSYNKFLCEKYLNEFFKKQHECYYTIIRPYVTYNEYRIPYPIIPQDNFYEYSLIERIKQGKNIPVIENGNIKTTITNTKDFAKGVVGLFCNDKAINEDFHITSNENVTWGMVIDYIKEYYHSDSKKVNFSIKEFGKEYPLYKDILLGDKGREMLFDDRKIKGVVPSFNCDILLKDGINDVIKFYEENKEFRNIDYYWYGKIDRICKDKKEKKFEKYEDKIKYNFAYYNFPIIILKVLRKLRIVK